MRFVGCLLTPTTTTTDGSWIIELSSWYVGGVPRSITREETKVIASDSQPEAKPRTVNNSRAEFIRSQLMRPGTKVRPQERSITPVLE